MNGLTLPAATSFNAIIPTRKDGPSPSNSMLFTQGHNFGTEPSSKSPQCATFRSDHLWLTAIFLGRSCAMRETWMLQNTTFTTVFVILWCLTALSRPSSTSNVILWFVTSAFKREIGRVKKEFLWITFKKCMTGMRNGSAGRKMWRSWRSTQELMMWRTLKSWGNSWLLSKILSVLLIDRSFYLHQNTLSFLQLFLCFTYPFL